MDMGMRKGPALFAARLNFVEFFQLQTIVLSTS